MPIRVSLSRPMTCTISAWPRPYKTGMKNTPTEEAPAHTRWHQRSPTPPYNTSHARAHAPKPRISKGCLTRQRMRAWFAQRVLRCVACAWHSLLLIILPTERTESHDSPVLIQATGIPTAPKRSAMFCNRF